MAAGVGPRRLLENAVARVVGHRALSRRDALGMLVVVLYTLSLPLIARVPFLAVPIAPLVGIGAALLVAGALGFPDVVLGLFLSNVLTFVFQMAAPELNRVSGWSLLPPVFIVANVLIFRRRVKFPVGLVGILQVFFAILMLFSTAYADQFDAAAAKVWRFSYHNLMPFVCPIAFTDDEKRLRNTVVSFWVGSCIWSIAGPFNVTASQDSRLDPVGLGPIGYGRVAAIVLLFILCRALTCRTRKRRIVTLLGSLPLAVWLSYHMVSTGTRGVVIAFVLAAFAALALDWKRTGSPAALFIGVPAAAAILMLALAFAPPEVAERLLLLETYQRELSPSVRGGIEYANRGYLYLQAWRMFRSSPLIGLGSGSFSVVAIYPHNIFLEVAVELGGLGLAVFVVFIVLTLKYGWQLLTDARYTDFHHRMGLFLLVGLAFYFLEAQFSGDILGNRLVWFFAGLTWAVYARRGDDVASAGKNQLRHGSPTCVTG